MRFAETQAVKKEFYGARENNKNLGCWCYSKLVEAKNNSKYLIGYLHEVVRPLASILPKMSGYI